ncbi:restriction endonuclease subunit S [Streptococcus suis]|nr:restriction endonuclease subunit S [Streptococcus suis]
MKTNNNIPAYRFQGYTDAWELRKLGEVIDNLKGGVSITPNDYIENGYRTIPKGAVNDTGVADLSSCKNVSADFFEKNYFSKTSTGELITSLRDLVPSAPNLGRIVRIVGQFEEFIMPQGVYSLKTSENLLEDFLIAYSNCYIYRNVIQSEKNGSTQVHIRNGEFLNIKIQLPTLPEQTAIGIFFSTLDRQITLHQRKLDTLKEQKKTYLKLLFPAKGQTKPALRFQGFEDDWEEVKLGEVVIWEKGSGLPKSDLNIEARGGQVIHYADLYRYKEVITEIFHSSESKEGKVIPLNSLLFPMSDVTPRGLARTSSISIEDVRAGGDILIANIKDNSSTFLSYQVNSNYQYILPLVTGTTVRHISSTSLSTIPISLPSLPEQEVIGTFFQTLDQEIAQVEDKLASLKEMKKTLLRKLFV